MAKKSITIDDIDAQIAALKEQKKQIIAEQQEAERKEREERQARIGKLVEEILGPVKDLSVLEKILRDSGISEIRSEQKEDISSIDFV